MEKRNIIVIGASAGGFEACRTLVKHLPATLDASIFIVWHMSPDVQGVLPHILNRVNDIWASHASDNEEIQPNRIYVAPPDHHLLLEDGYMRVTRGPKENRFRPAVDPLFRSAAFHYGKRVIGVILSGALDDGTSGLWTVKHYGGLAIVQSPTDAPVPSMPENAIREVAVDYIASVEEIAGLLVELSAEEVDKNKDEMKQDERTAIEIKIAEESNALKSGIMNFGEHSQFTCPECHGVLSTFPEGNRTRYRCHTGHAFSADSLLATITEKIEGGLYSALRAIEESIMLLNNTGDHFAAGNHPKLAALYFKKAKEAEERARLVREAILSNERLSNDSLLHMSEEMANGDENKENGTEMQTLTKQNRTN